MWPSRNLKTFCVGLRFRKEKDEGEVDLWALLKSNQMFTLALCIKVNWTLKILTVCALWIKQVLTWLYYIFNLLQRRTWNSFLNILKINMHLILFWEMLYYHTCIFSWKEKYERNFHQLLYTASVFQSPSLCCS